MAQNKNHIEQFTRLYKDASQALYFALANQPVQSLPQTQNKQKQKQFGKQTKTFKKSIFDYVQDFTIDESLQNRINSIKLNSHFNQKVKESVFKKLRLEQQQLHNKNRKVAQRIYQRKEVPVKMNFEKYSIKLEGQEREYSFTISYQDLTKLGPQADLNDTIVDFYLKYIQNVSLPLKLQNQTYCFSSFFMEKLIAEFGKDDYINDRDSQWLISNVKNKVTLNYPNVKRWTRKDDIFQKEIVVFPINAFRHWFCIILLRPYAIINQESQNKCQLIYCDSMFEKKRFIVAAIRRYLQLQSLQRKGKISQLNQSSLPCYQLLLPRQTNTHDCGIYMLVYIEQLCSNPKYLELLIQIKNRRKLNLFPRTLIFSMRQRLRRLINRLINAPSSNQILKEFMNQRQQIMKTVNNNDYDRLNMKDQQIYEKMYIGTINGDYSYEQKSFMCQIKFYLDPQINFYQKDR